MTSSLPEPVGGELAVPGHFAQRTAQLAQQPQPVVRWQKAIWGHPHVRPDDTIAVAVRGDGGRWWAVVLDPSSGVRSYEKAAKARGYEYYAASSTSRLTATSTGTRTS